jgi:hypothetical protein
MAHLRHSGFEVLRLARVTTGPRAVLTLLFSPRFEPGFSQGGFLGKSIDLCMRWVAYNKKRIQLLSDKVHGKYRVVWDRPDSLYMILFVIAEKKETLSGQP